LTQARGAMSCRVFLEAVVASLLIFLSAPAGWTAERPGIEIKFAALPPEGSTWLKVMRTLDKTLREKSGGRLGFRIYPGGIAGDELDVLRKIQIGQIHAAAFSGAGLTRILPEVRVLDLPFLFHSLEEADRVHAELRDHFAELFRTKGFEFLSWAEVGNVHLFSKNTIRRVSDISRCKVWTWSGDPISQETFQAMGTSPIPLAVTDVTTSLSTGMIDTVYGPPLGALALQWHAYTKTMTSLPLAHATGAFLLSERFYREMPEDLQVLLSEECVKSMAALTRELRDQSQEAVRIIEQSGLTVIPDPSGDDLAAFYRVHDLVAERLADKVYSRKLLDRIYAVLGRTP